jgi:hypothetical protein
MAGVEDPVFSIKAWVTYSMKDFQEKLEEIIETGIGEIPSNLENELPIFPQSKGLDCTLRIIYTEEAELFLEIRVNEESELKEFQSQSLTDEKLISLITRIYHPESLVEKRIHEKPFLERLNKTLSEVESTYLNSGKNFGVNVSTPGVVLFQIVNRSMLESIEDEEPGLGLHLTFDKSFSGSEQDLKLFEKQEYSKRFKSLELDGIPTYQIDLQRNNAEVKRIVKRLIEDVYQEKLEEIDLEIFEIQ